MRVTKIKPALRALLFVALQCAGIGTAAAAEDQPQKVPAITLSVHLLAECGTADASPSFTHKAESVCVREPALFDEKDVTNATVEPVGQDYQLVLVLTEPAGSRVGAASKQNLHQKLALLVDGQVLAMPVIQDSFSRVVAFAGASEETLRDLARRLTAQIAAEKSAKP